MTITPTLRSWLQTPEAFDVAMVPSFLGVFAHAGAMGALQREGLLDNVVGLAGASAGSQCGAILAAGKRVLAERKSVDDQAPRLHDDMARLTRLGDRRWEVEPMNFCICTRFCYSAVLVARVTPEERCRFHATMATGARLGPWAWRLHWSRRREGTMLALSIYFVSHDQACLWCAGDEPPYAAQL